MHYVKLLSVSLINDTYVFVDTPEYLADQLFIKHKVRVNFNKGEMKRPGGPYVVVFCTVRKKDTDRFLAAMDELPNKMLLLGHDDYTEYCGKNLSVISSKARGPQNAENATRD